VVSGWRGMVNCRTVLGGRIARRNRSVGRKHGVRDEQIRLVIAHCGLAFDQPAPDGAPGESRLVFLGDDPHGVPLEVVAVVKRGR
jgi:hypothetical protein